MIYFYAMLAIFVAVVGHMIYEDIKKYNDDDLAL